MFLHRIGKNTPGEKELGRRYPWGRIQLSRFDSEGTFRQEIICRRCGICDEVQTGKHTYACDEKILPLITGC